MTRAARSAMEAHIASCEQCCRYDRVIRTGVDVLRKSAPGGVCRPLGVVAVRRRARIAERRESHAAVSRAAVTGTGSRTTVATAVAVAAVLAGIAWLPAVFSATPEASVAPVLDVTADRSPWPASIRLQSPASNRANEFSYSEPHAQTAALSVMLRYRSPSLMRMASQGPAWEASSWQRSESPEDLARAMLVEYRHNRARGIARTVVSAPDPD